jgi:hypothetical protein
MMKLFSACVGLNQFEHSQPSNLFKVSDKAIAIGAFIELPKTTGGHRLKVLVLEFVSR